MKHILFWLFSSLFLFSCKTTNKTSTPSLDTRYLLVGIRMQNNFVQLELDHGTNAYIEFISDEKIFADSGVNSGSGFYTMQNGNGFVSCKIQNLGVTKMAGANEKQNAFDAQFFTLLQTVAFAKRDAHLLHLYDNSKTEILTFYKR